MRPSMLRSRCGEKEKRRDNRRMLPRRWPAVSLKGVNIRKAVEEEDDGRGLAMGGDENAGVELEAVPLALENRVLDLHRHDGGCLFFFALRCGATSLGATCTDYLPGAFGSKCWRSDRRPKTRSCDANLTFRPQTKVERLNKKGGLRKREVVQKVRQMRSIYSHLRTSKQGRAHPRRHEYTHTRFIARTITERDTSRRPGPRAAESVLTL